MPNYKHILVSESSYAGEHIQQFIDYHIAKGSAAATIKYYRTCLPIIIEETAEWDSIDSESLMAKINQKQIKPASKNTYRRAVRAFLKWAGKPVAITIHEAEVSPATYSDSDIKVLLAKPKNPTFTDWETYTMICLAIDTGMRINSLREARIADIQDSQLVIRNTKSHKLQIMPFSATTKSALTTYLRYRDVAGDDYLFCNVYGDKLTKDCPYKMLRRYCEDRHIQCKGWHAFRRYFAKSMVRAGIDAFTLKEYMAHSSVEITQRYVNWYGDELIDRYKSPIEALQRRHIH